MSYYAHDSAVIDDGAQIGEGTKVWHFTHIMPKARLGRNCNLGQNVFVANNVKLGDGVKVQNNVSIYEGVEIEDDVFCGPSMVFTNDLNPRAAYPKGGEYVRTLVRRGASIGANATIICGTTIGKWAFIGAGAVVTRDVPAHAIMAGIPAKRTGWMCECGLNLDESLTCGCGRAYAETPSGLQEKEPELTNA